MNPNVLILIVDSLRADKLFGKNKSSITPNIDGLIRSGIYFSQAISSSDSTGICLGSLFTSLHPFKTGISSYSYKPEIQTLFHFFKDKKYNIYATIPDLVFFKRAIPEFCNKDYYIYDKRENWVQLEGGIGQQIIKNFKNNLHDPWLYYIHLMDLHAPFSLPRDFDSEKYGKTRHDRMISLIDFWIGKFISEINLQNTLVLISSDHGDLIAPIDNWNDPVKVHSILKQTKNKIPIVTKIGEKPFFFWQSLKRKNKIKKLRKGLTEKQLASLMGRATEYLYDDSIRVPLLFAGYGISEPKIISNQIRQVDIFPTIVDLLGFGNIENRVDGQSLVPFLNDNLLPEKSAYIETGFRNFKNTKNPKLHGKIIGIRTSKYKYWRSRTNPQKNLHLYDLENDPNEERNIAEENPSIINSMEKFLMDLKKDSIKFTNTQFTNEEEKAIEEELKKLGYM